HESNFTDCPRIQQILYFSENRHLATVMGNRQFVRFALQGIGDLAAISDGPGEWFFKVNILSGFDSLKRVFYMAGRRGGDVHSIDFGIVEQSRRIVVPVGHAVTLSKVPGFGPITTHDRYQFRAVCFLKSRSAFYFGYIPTADDSPFGNILLHNKRM